VGAAAALQVLAAAAPLRFLLDSWLDSYLEMHLLIF
jgi:hypothetical protein